MRTRSTKRLAAGGFTIVELLVTMALASLLLAIAVPSFRNISISNRLTTQANEFASAINLARSESIKGNRAVTLCRSTDATTCANSSANWTAWIIRTAAGTVVRRGTVDTSGGTLQVQSTLTNDVVTFTPDGLVSTGGALVADQEINVCSSSTTTDNFRRVVLGAGSRISTSVDEGTCE